MGDETTVTAWTEVVRGVYDDHHGRLWRAVLAWSGSVDVTDDAVAEAFAQLLRRGDEVRNPHAWVWRAAFKLAAGDLQRQRASAQTTRRADGGDPLDRVAAPPDRLPDDAIDLLRGRVLVIANEEGAAAFWHP